MGVASFTDLARHCGHKIEVVVYGGDGNIGGAENVAIECETCSEVLIDFDVDETHDIGTVKAALEGPMKEVYLAGFVSGQEEQHKRTFPGYNRDDVDVEEYWTNYWKEGKDAGD